MAAVRMYDVTLTVSFTCAQAPPQEEALSLTCETAKVGK